jgi:hypothetical protein|tara:strand:+ start:397 stop:717 length:321 start_codon:yes stop_codon:yes gene_type:complete
MEILVKGLIGVGFIMFITFVVRALKVDSSLDKKDLDYIRQVSKKHKLHKLDLEESAQEEALTKVNESKNSLESSNLDDLLKLKELLDSDLLTREEFEEQKKKLLKQ